MGGNGGVSVPSSASFHTFDMSPAASETFALWLSLRLLLIKAFVFLLATLYLCCSPLGISFPQWARAMTFLESYSLRVTAFLHGPSKLYLARSDGFTHGVEASMAMFSASAKALVKMFTRRWLGSPDDMLGK